MKKKFLRLITALFVLSLAGTANASLSSHDLSTPGDSHLTYDSNTGFSWLDLTETYGQSYNAVLSGFGGFTTTFGFRYATGNEVAKLLTDAGITEGGSKTWDITNINNTRSLENLIGVTYTDGHTFDSYGYIADPSPGVHAFGGLSVNDIGEYDATSSAIITPSLQGYLNIVGAGSFLVKPVPLPAAVWLFSSGLLGLAGIARHRKVD